MRVPPKMADAMAAEKASADLGPAEELFDNKSKRRPPEYISQLALKRGKQLRGAEVKIDTNSVAVRAQLLSRNPDMSLFHRAPQSALDAYLHWFDELEGCALHTYFRPSLGR